MVLLRRVRRLQYQSDHDLFTGLLSRRPMEQLLLSESQRQRRFGRSFALLSVDIDHFKKINDGWGHAAGDAVLKRVAEALRAAARDIDSVARMGGEEFCALLPGADVAGAESVAVRLLETVRGLHHPEIGGASRRRSAIRGPRPTARAAPTRSDQSRRARSCAAPSCWG